MPLTTFRDIAQEFKGEFDSREPELPRWRGLITRIRNSFGVDSVEVENRPGYIWVRLFSQDGNAQPVYNRKVNPMNDMPVFVGYMPGTRRLEIVGIDRDIADADSDYLGFAYLPKHAQEHEWSDAGHGPDPVSLYPRAWAQLRTFPTNPASLSVTVAPMRYIGFSAVVKWEGDEIDLTANVPGGANQARLVLVYLDTTTNTLGLTNGDIGLVADGWFLPEPALSNETYPSAVVRLINGQTTITESDIQDRRMFLNPTYGVFGGWPFDTNMTSVDPSDPNADYNSLEDALDNVASGTIMAASGTYNVNNKTLALGVNFVCKDEDGVIIQSTTNDVCLNLVGNNYVSNVTVRSVRTGAAAVAIAIDIADATATYFLQHVTAYASSAGEGGDAYAIRVTQQNYIPTTTFVDVDAEATANDVSHALFYNSIGEETPVSTIVDGSYNGDTNDIYSGGWQVRMVWPRLINNSLGGTINNYRCEYHGISSQSAVFGGRANQATGNYSGAIGFGALANLHGQVAQTGDYRSAYGDMQTSVLTVGARTTNNTQTEAFLDGPGGSARLVLPSDTTWAFDIMAVARRTDADNESAMYWARGGIDNNAGVVALVGAVSYYHTIEDTAAWSWAVDADAANNSLRVRFTGENAKTILWEARVTLTQVTG